MKASTNKVYNFNEIDSDSDATSISEEQIAQLISSESSREESPIQILEPAQPPKFVESIQPQPIKPINKQPQQLQSGVQKEYWNLNEVDDEDDQDEEDFLNELDMQQQQEVEIEKELSNQGQDIEEEQQPEYMEQYIDIIEEEQQPQQIDQELINKKQIKHHQYQQAKKAEHTNLLEGKKQQQQSGNNNSKRDQRYNPKSSLIYFRLMGKEHQYKKYQEQSATEELPNQDDLVDDLELDFAKVENIISAGLSIKKKQFYKETHQEKIQEKQKERNYTPQQKKERKPPRPREEDKEQEQQKDRYVFSIKGKKATFSGLVLYQVEIMDKAKLVILGIQWLRYSEIALISKGVEEIYNFENRACDKLAHQLQCKKIEKYQHIQSFLQFRIVDGFVFDSNRVYIQEEILKSRAPSLQKPQLKEEEEEYYTTRKTKKQQQTRPRPRPQPKVQQTQKKPRKPRFQEELDLQEDSFMEALKYLEQEVEILDDQLLNADEIKLFKCRKFQLEQRSKKRLIYDEDDEDENPIRKNKDENYKVREKKQEIRQPTREIISSKKKKIQRPTLELVGERIVEPIKKKIVKQEPIKKKLQLEEKVKFQTSESRENQEISKNSPAKIPKKNKQSQEQIEQAVQQSNEVRKTQDEVDSDSSKSLLDIDNIKILTQAKGNESKNEEGEQVYVSAKKQMRKLQAAEVQEKISKKLKKDSAESVKYFYDPQVVQQPKKRSYRRKQDDELPNEKKERKKPGRKANRAEENVLDGDLCFTEMEKELKDMYQSFHITGHRTIDNKIILSLEYLTGVQTEERRDVVSKNHQEQVANYFKSYLNEYQQRQ